MVKTTSPAAASNLEDLIANLSHAFIPVVTAWFADSNTVPEYEKAVAFLRTEGGRSANKQWTKIYLDALHAHAQKIDADIDTEGVDAADLFCSIIYSLKTDSGLTATRWKRVVLGDRDQHIRNAITLTVPRVVAECGEEDDGEPTGKSERVETYNDDYHERYSSEGEEGSLASEGEGEEESLASEGEEVGDSQGSEEEEEESVPVPVKPKRGSKPKKAEEVAEATPPKRVEGVAGSKPRKAIKAKKN